MKPHDRLEICCAILKNAGIQDYWLADSTRLVVPHLDNLTALQRVAVRVAAAIWSGRLEPDVASILGLG
jgi:hypothetical protein